MKDILLIRGGDSRDIIDALWVADEIADAMGEDVQIDIAVPEAYAAYARLSTSVRRVIALPAVEHFSAGADDEAGDSGGGAGDAASVATGAAKKLFSFAKNVAASAGGNLRAYKAVAGDLRLVKYDTVFDFDSSGASLAVARLLKVKEIVGFDEKNIKSPLPGATMMYHATPPYQRRHKQQHATAATGGEIFFLRSEKTRLQNPPYRNDNAGAAVCHHRRKRAGRVFASAARRRV